MDKHNPKEEHFVKLPSRYKDAHYQKWISIAVYRLLMVLNHQPEPSRLGALKKSGLTSTRIKLTSETQNHLFDLMKKHSLNKLETFLFVFDHIESNPSVYYKKCSNAA